VRAMRVAQPAAIAILIKQYFEPGTALGRKTLEYLQTLFAPRLRELDRLRPGGRSSDAVLLAALFGIDVLPVHLYPGVELVRPKKKSSDSSSCGSSSDSGFHDSDSGGDSGGDGGGGCGGCGG
jgi:uncharacterized membrane protein YgcG